MFNLFKKDDFESHKIIENSSAIHAQLADPSKWVNSMDTFLSILESSHRIADQTFAKKEYSKALQLYFKRLNNGALNIGEDKSYTFLKIGHLLRLLNDDDKAIISYRNALDINPDLDSAVSSFSLLIEKHRNNSTFL